MAKILIGNVKGPQGDTGAQGAAGTIANVTASVNNTVGTPSVDVTLGGTPQNRTFNLAFKNLKGDTGAQGTMDHRALGHRNDANQHTIAAITGLQNALETSGAHIGPTAPTDATKIWVDTDENSETLPLATTTEPGLMSAEDKVALAGKFNSADMADYIVERGTEGIWYWEKWASGKAVCYGTLLVKYMKVIL